MGTTDRTRRAWLAAGLASAANAAFGHGPPDRGWAAAEAKKEQRDWGIAGDRAAVRRTVEVKMLDTMRFVPDRIDVRLGETLRLVVRNRGKVMHELVIGTKAELAAHAELMKRFPDMEHDEPYMAHVPPGGRREVVWTFNRPGTFAFACLVAGHYAAGMAGTIHVREGDSR